MPRDDNSGRYSRAINATDFKQMFGARHWDGYKSYLAIINALSPELMDSIDKPYNFDEKLKEIYKARGRFFNTYEHQCINHYFKQLRDQKYQAPTLFEEI